MTTRSENLINVLDGMVDRFGLAILESKDPFLLVKRSGIGMQREELKVLLEQMRQKSAEKVKGEIDQLVEDNEIVKKLAELEDYVKEGEEMNKKVGLKRGYLNVQPSVDVAFHLSKHFETLMEPLDEEIRVLEDELADLEKELSAKTSEFTELAKKVESQQEKLGNE